MTLLSQFLYLSRIVGPQEFETIAAVAAQARLNNARLGITGLMVFDGAQVCQYVEGAPPAIDGLVARLREDPRHGALRVLHQGPLDGARRFAGWRMGYLLLDNGDDLTRFESVTGPRAVDFLLEQLPLVDVEP